MQMLSTVDGVRCTNRVNHLQLQSGLGASETTPPPEVTNPPRESIHMQMDESPTTDPPEYILGKLETRIRSISTLLRWVFQQSTPGLSRRRDENVAQFLDRVALMFVSGRHRSDVAAVVPTFDPHSGYGLTAVAIQEYDFDLVKNLVKEADTRYVKS